MYGNRNGEIMPKKKNHYIDNEEMLQELISFKENGTLSENLHLMFYEMAKKIGTKPRFSGYTWIEDMVSDAYLKCCNVAHKFDPDKTQNPFGYFSTVIIHYFWDALQGEDKQKKVKERLRDEQLAMIYYRYGITFKVGSGTRPTDA
jgi:hypothetical protein